MRIDKKKWFDVPDSETEDERKKLFFNVEARFSDHPVIDMELSRTARRNIYKFSIVLHTRVKRAAIGGKAQPNMSTQSLRFDKGAAMGAADFEASKAAIMRCWEAWEHYCRFREAPVTVAEKMALEQIQRAPLSKLGVVHVQVGDRLVAARMAGDDSEDEDLEDEDDPRLSEVVREAKAEKPARRKPGRPRKIA